MLLAQKSYVEGALALLLYCSRLVDEESTADTQEARDAAHLLLDVLTPIAKSWPSQWCLEANSLAIQVHGGYGYTRDYDVEQLYRDNRLNPIHEGTHGIQGLDLLGRKVVMQGGAGLALLGGAIARDRRRAPATTRTPQQLARDARRGVDRGHGQQLWAPMRPRARAGQRVDSTSRPSGTSWSPGCGSSSCWQSASAQGDFYDGKRAGGARTSSATSSRGPARSSTCWPGSTARPSTPGPSGCDARSGPGELLLHVVDDREVLGRRAEQDDLGVVLDAHAVSGGPVEDVATGTVVGPTRRL